VLALQLGPLCSRGSAPREADVAAALKRIPVKLGGGRLTASLHDLLPAFCLADLVKCLEEHARDAR